MAPILAPVVARRRDLRLGLVSNASMWHKVS